MAKAKQSLDKELADMMAADGGKGNVPTAYCDAAPWLDDLSNTEKSWINALAAFDHKWRPDRSALLSMLRSKKPISSVVEHHLANLIGRYDISNKDALQEVVSDAARNRLRLADLVEQGEFKKPRHRPGLPSYHSEAEYRMEQKVERVRALSHPRNPRRKTRSEAIALVAEQSPFVPETIKNACDGKRGAVRAQRKRRRPQGL